METWFFLIDSEPGEPFWNMALDEALLWTAAERPGPVLRFYQWARPAATFGLLQRYAEVEQWTDLRPLIRRPTGGGLVPHQNDWTYSVAIPPQHDWYHLKAKESYVRLHRWLAAAFQRVGFDVRLAPVANPEGLGRCFVGAEQHDLLLAGRKIGGAAQRRTRSGLLIQGSIQPPPPVDRQEWIEAVQSIATSWWQVRWKRFRPTTSLLELAHRLREEKYCQDTYNRRR